MKKILLSAAAFAVVAVSTAVVAPTTSEAIPAFARQTGAACLACHFQTFPAINAFGRAFKMGSFTDVGEQALVEDDNMSIPAVLNATVVIRGNYTNSKTTGTGATGTWNVPSETPILIAGRVGSNSGAFVEFGNAGAGPGSAVATTVNANVGVGNWQFLNSFDMGGFKLGVSAHNSSFGGSAIMEVSNVFGQHSGKLNGGGLSAINAAGFNANTLGAGAWIGNDMGNIQFSLIAPSGAQATDVGFKLGKLVRGVFTTELGGFDTLIGAGFVFGEAGRNTATGVGPVPMNLQFVDVQFQGEVGDMSLGIYGDYANAKGKTATGGALNFVAGALSGVNFYGGAPAGGKFDAWSLRAELKPLHNVGVGVGFASQKLTNGVAGAPAQKITTAQVAAFYEVYQNFEINLIYNSAKTSNAGFVLGAPASTVSSTRIEFEALM